MSITVDRPLVAPRAAPVARAAARKRNLRNLRPMVIAGALLPLIIWLPEDSGVATTARLLASLMWVLCWVPAWHYVSLPAERRPPIPFMPIIGIVHAVYYPLQLIVGADNTLLANVGLNPAVDYDRPMELALVGWVCLLAGAYLFRGRHRPFGPLALSDASVELFTPLCSAAVFVGLLFEVLRQLSAVPAVLGGALTFVLNVAVAAASFLTIRSAQGALSRPAQLRLVIAVALYAALRVGSGSIAQPLTLLMTVGLALWIGGQRIRPSMIVGAALLLCTAVSIKGILSDYRDQTWFSSEARSLPERTGLIAHLLGRRIDEVGVVRTVNMGWDAVIGRSATTDLLGDIVKRTPDPVPYWGGRTYVSLVGAFVPRVLWPDKPKKTLGQDFGHRYGYLHSTDLVTSINFPFLVEFYANFGEIGVLLGMLVVGLIFRMLERFLNAPGQGIVATALGLVMLISLTNVESDFSLIFGGLFLNIVAFAAIVRLARGRIAGRLARRVKVT